MDADGGEMARTPRKGPGTDFKAVERAGEVRRNKRQSPFEQYAARLSFDFEDVNAATLCDGLHHALARGSALTFSMTKDGGAVKVSIWLDNQKFEAYAADSVTFNALLETLTDIEDEPGPEVA
jgi:hypothetical protein